MNQLFNKTYHKLEVEKSKEEILMIQIILQPRANQRPKLHNNLVLVKRTIRKMVKANKSNSLQRLNQPLKDRRQEQNRKKFRIKLSMIIFLLLVKNN